MPNVNPFVSVKVVETKVDEKASAKRVRHFSISPEYRDEEIGEKNATIVTFVSVSANPDKEMFDSCRDSVTTALYLSCPGALILETKEESFVPYPIIEIFEAGHKLNDEDVRYLSLNGFTLKTSSFQEVKNINPVSGVNSNERHDSVPFSNSSQARYIILGFNATDKRFKKTLIDSWKEWTGARYMYVNLPENLGLVQIRLYCRIDPDFVFPRPFNYIVLAQCNSVNTREKQIALLDFVQRFRAERTSAFISVYEVVAA